METDLITIEEACDLLQVSRPTFNKIRRSLQLTEYAFGKRVRFSRSELLERIQQQRKSLTRLNAVAVEEVNLDEVWQEYKRLDLDRIANIDAYCASVLLCSSIFKLQHSEIEVFSRLTLNASYFYQQNFFSYLNKFGRERARIDSRILSSSKITHPEIILPITQIGFKSADEKIMKNLSLVLKQHGFSEDITGYISWALGELADNSHTHGEVKGLCFISIERLIGEHQFLQINIVDLGVGIQTTLKKNPMYSSLDDSNALLIAFKPNVSSWPEEAKRGKGLTDIFKIAMQCKSFLRVESNDQAFLFDFQNPLRPMEKIHPSAALPGTRFSITLIDNFFEHKVKREDVSHFIEKCMEDL